MASESARDGRKFGTRLRVKKTQNEKINTLPQTNTIAMSLRILTLKPLEKKAGVLLGQGFHFEGPTLRSTDFVIEPPKKNWFSLFLTLRKTTKPKEPRQNSEIASTKRWWARKMVGKSPTWRIIPASK